MVSAFYFIYLFYFLFYIYFYFTSISLILVNNFCQGLKRHAVTMFEVGKLPDENMENFVSELEKVC